MTRIGLAVVAFAMSLACSSDGPTVPDAPFPLEPFQEMARNVPCDERRNDLDLLDGTFVLHHREQPGTCLHAGNAIKLFGSTPQDLPCWYAEGNFGPDPPPDGCFDPAHVPLFAVIRASWQVPRCGLGPSHVLEPIPF